MHVGRGPGLGLGGAWVQLAELGVASAGLASATRVVECFSCGSGGNVPL